jgi:hypothetical protein
MRNLTKWKTIGVSSKEKNKRVRFVFVEVLYKQPDESKIFFNIRIELHIAMDYDPLSPYIFFSLSSGMRSIQDKVIVVLLYVKKKKRFWELDGNNIRWSCHLWIHRKQHPLQHSFRFFFFHFQRSRSHRIIIPPIKSFSFRGFVKLFPIHFSAHLNNRAPFFFAS